MFSVCGQLAGGNCTTGRISGVSTEQHVKETLNRDKLMRFYGVNLSDLRLSFPLPAHLDRKRAESLSHFSGSSLRQWKWSIVQLKRVNEQNCRSICRIGFDKTVMKPKHAKTRVKQHIADYSLATLASFSLRNLLAICLFAFSLAFSTQFWKIFPKQGGLVQRSDPLPPLWSFSFLFLFLFLILLKLFRFFMNFFGRLPFI